MVSAAILPLVVEDRGPQRLGIGHARAAVHVRVHRWLHWMFTGKPTTLSMSSRHRRPTWVRRIGWRQKWRAAYHFNWAVVRPLGCLRSLDRASLSPLAWGGWRLGRGSLFRRRHGKDTTQQRRF